MSSTSFIIHCNTEDVLNAIKYNFWLKMMKITAKCRLVYLITVQVHSVADVLCVVVWKEVCQCMEEVQCREGTVWLVTCALPPQAASDKALCKFMLQFS